MRRALIGLIASGALAASSAVGAQSLGDRFKQFMGSMDGANAAPLHTLMLVQFNASLSSRTAREARRGWCAQDAFASRAERRWYPTTEVPRATQV